MVREQVQKHSFPPRPSLCFDHSVSNNLHIVTIFKMNEHLSFTICGIWPQWDTIVSKESAIQIDLKIFSVCNINGESVVGFVWDYEICIAIIMGHQIKSILYSILIFVSDRWIIDIWNSSEIFDGYTFC